MVIDIINVFERKFNKFAEGTNAFTTRFFRDDDSAVGTLCFNSFNVEFEYRLECGESVQKSCLCIIVDFSKRLAYPLKCMMYDIIGLLDKYDFSCWLYSYIENEQRMELCFDKLTEDFSRIYPLLSSAAQNPDLTEQVSKILSRNLEVSVGVDFLEELSTEGSSEFESSEETVDFLYGLYFGFQTDAFSSDEYRDFLAGDGKKALRKYEKKKRRLEYEERLIDHIKACDHIEPILTEEYECLKDGLREYRGTSGSLPFFVSWGLLFIPLLALCVIMYFSVVALLFRNCEYSSAFEPYNACCCIIPALIGSIAAGYLLRERIYRRFFKKKYRKMMDYDAIFNPKKTVRRMRVFCYLIYVAALIFVFLAANNAVSFNEQGMNVSRGLFDLRGSSYTYNEVEAVEKAEDGSCTVYFSDGESARLNEFASDEDIEKKIIPIFSDRGIDTVTQPETE